MDLNRYPKSPYRSEISYLEMVFETTTAGVSIQAPQLDITNVFAAGGGSQLFLRNSMFFVGPESAGAHPGPPVCYRKNGNLAVTDANVVLGHVLPQYFPPIFSPNEDQPLDLEGAQKAFAELRDTEEGQNYTAAEEIAYGFLQVANEAMCRPIRNLSQMKGFDITTHMLACLGGAGPQHASAIAKALGTSKVFVHRYGGVLSAYGLSMADAVNEKQEPAADVYDFGQAFYLKDDQAGGILDVIEGIIDYDADKCGVNAFQRMGVLSNDADLEKVKRKGNDNFQTGKNKV